MDNRVQQGLTCSRNRKGLARQRKRRGQKEVDLLKRSEHFGCRKGEGKVKDE